VNVANLSTLSSGEKLMEKLMPGFGQAGITHGYHSGCISKTGRAKLPISGSMGVSPMDGAKRRPHAGFDAVKMPVPRHLVCPVFEMRPARVCPPMQT
jgi:hypothetical protein